MLVASRVAPPSTCTCCFVFFFSSRRRRTRWPRDWSSDVCSPDLPQLLSALGRERTRHDHARFPDLGQPLGNQFGLNFCGVNLLHPPGRLISGKRRDLFQHAGGVLIARPQPLKVEHAQPAEFPALNRGLGAHYGVHRSRDDWQLELVRIDLPGQGHLLRIAGAARGHHGDVVEGVCAAPALASTDFDLSHPFRLPVWGSPVMSVGHGKVRFMSSAIQNLSSVPWPDGPLIGFDTETTGVDVSEDRIVTAAIVEPIDGETQVHEWLINPGVEIPERATEVHGVTTDHARAHGLDPRHGLEEIAEKIAEHLREERPIVAFNVVFDLSILDAELRRYELRTVPERIPGEIIPVLDPLVIDRRVDRYRRGKRTLAHLCEFS